MRQLSCGAEGSLGVLFKGVGEVGGHNVILCKAPLHRHCEHKPGPSYKLTGETGSYR